MIKLYGHPYTFRLLSRRMGIKMGTLMNRYHRGDRGTRLVRPVRSHGDPLWIKFHGKDYTYRGLGD